MNIMPYLIRGLATGGQFALVAIGYTMVYGILKLINFAHGDLFMVSGMLLIYLMADFPTMPPLVAIIIMIALTVLIGFLIEKMCIFAAPLSTAYVGNDLGYRRFLSASECRRIRYRWYVQAVSRPPVPERQLCAVRSKGQDIGIPFSGGRDSAHRNTRAHHQSYKIRYVDARGIT